MKSQKKRLLAISALIVVLLGIIGGWILVSPNSFFNRPSAIQTTLEWARLNPFPVADSELEIETDGSMFTREFIISFSSDPDVIRSWLEDSPGTKGMTPENEPGGWLRYDIEPGGGAVHAEVRMSPDKTKVVVRAVWS